MNLTLEKYLLDFGFKLKDIEKMKNNFILRQKSEETLIKNMSTIIELLFSFGYSKGTIIKTLTYNPTLCIVTEETIKEKINYFISLGYMYKDVMKMVKINPKIYTASIQNIKDKFDFLLSLNFSKYEVINVTKKIPSIYEKSNKKLQEKIDNLLSLGLTEKQAISMIKKSPQLLCYDINSLKGKINIFMLYGYKYEEVLKIIEQFPSVLNLSDQKIKEKLSFYKLIKIEKVFVNQPNKLIQGIELSYARYMFLRSKGIIIDENNVRKLFVSEAAFDSMYKINTDDLIKLYNYRNVIREKSKQMIKERLSKRNG